MRKAMHEVRSVHTVIAVSIIALLVSQPMVIIRAGGIGQSSQGETKASGGTKSQAEAVKLEAGKTIERELRGGEEHTYEIVLTANQYLNVVVDQRGIDVVVTVIGPDGKQIAEIDNPTGAKGQEPIMLVAEVSGSYMLNVRPSGKEAAAGRYEIRIVELRAATGQDRALQKSRKLYEESVRLKDKGKYDEAAAVGERALAIREEVLGSDHPDVAACLNNLGQINFYKGEYAKAEPLLQRSLAIWEKALGPYHPDVASSLNNLAVLYNDKGEYAKAEPLYQRSLAIGEKALGPDHPDVALSLNNLALLYDDKGEYAKAEPLYQRSLAINEKVLGPDHPDIATSLNNLAGLYYSKGVIHVAARRPETMKRTRVVNCDKVKTDERRRKVGFSLSHPRSQGSLTRVAHKRPKLLYRHSPEERGGDFPHLC